MTTSMSTPTHPVRTVPRAVQLAVLAWLTAIAAGAVETAVRLGLPDPPTGTELALRFGVYSALVLLVLALRTGRNAVRLALTVLLGGLGMASLIVEPVTALLDGASVTGYLATADGPTWMITALRAAHIAAVLVALVAMYRPSANSWFRARPR